MIANMGVTTTIKGYRGIHAKSGIYNFYTPMKAIPFSIHQAALGVANMGEPLPSRAIEVYLPTCAGYSRTLTSQLKAEAGDGNALTAASTITIAKEITNSLFIIFTSSARRLFEGF